MIAKRIAVVVIVLMAGALTLGGVVLAQDAAKVQPGSYRVVLENKSVRVLEYNGLPGMGVCGSGVHSHPAHLTILLSAAHVRVKEKGRVFEVTNNPGDVFWSEAVTHETENIGTANVRSLIVELKTPAHGI
jgi:hypothetical protein